MSIRVYGTLAADAQWRVSAGRWPTGFVVVSIITGADFTCRPITASISYGSRATAHQAGQALARVLRKGHRVSIEADGINAALDAVNPSGLIAHDIARPRHEPAEREGADA